MMMMIIIVKSKLSAIARELQYTLIPSLSVNICTVNILLSNKFE